MIFLDLAQLITLIRVGPSPYEWITPRIWDALWGLGVILSPVAIGLPLAWRDGMLAGLMVVAFQYIMVDDLVDCIMVGGHPAYGICLCTSRQATVIVLSCLPALLFLVVSPMWVLRSRSARGRAWGLILPLFIAVVSGEVIRAILCLATPSEYWIDWWFTHILSSGQYLIAVALAAVIYHWIERQGPAAGTQGHREG